MSEPERVTREDVAGLRNETGRLADSVDKLAERQQATEQKVELKADQATVDAIAALQKGRRTNHRLAILALLLVLGGIVYVVRNNSDRINAAASTRSSSRTAFCHSLDDIGSAIVAGAGAVIANPSTLQNYETATDAAIVKVKASNGFAPDCSPLGGK